MDLTIKRYAQVIELPIEGEHWFNRQVDYKAPRVEFIQGKNEQLQGSTKGVLRSSLEDPWRHIALCVQKYLTYEG